MSRHEFLPPDWSSDYAFAVGWDPALETFFAQVMDYSISHDDDCVIIWLTPKPREILDVDTLMRTVNRRIQGRLPEVRLTRKLRDRLMGDKAREDEGRWITEPSRKRPLCALDLACGRTAATTDRDATPSQ